MALTRASCRVQCFPRGSGGLSKQVKMRDAWGCSHDPSGGVYGKDAAGRLADEIAGP